jgi:hypothetical protein
VSRSARQYAVHTYHEIKTEQRSYKRSGGLVGPGPIPHPTYLGDSSAFVVRTRCTRFRLFPTHEDSSQFSEIPVGVSWSTSRSNSAESHRLVSPELTRRPRRPMSDCRRGLHAALRVPVATLASNNFIATYTNRLVIVVLSPRRRLAVSSTSDIISSPPIESSKSSSITRSIQTAATLQQLLATGAKQQFASRSLLRSRLLGLAGRFWTVANNAGTMQGSLGVR